MRKLLAVTIVAIAVITGIISCTPQALPSAPPPAEAQPPPVDESYYDSDEVIAIIKKHLPDVVKRYSTTDKAKIMKTDLLTIGRWEAIYLGKGKWQVTCDSNFVNWFDYEKPMKTTGKFSWNFYEKSGTIETISYREITYGEFKY